MLKQDKPQKHCARHKETRHKGHICCMVSHKYEIFTVSRLVFAGDWSGEGMERWLLNGCELSIWDNENVLELDSADGCTAL